jgi:hypothetical protein
MTNETKDLNSNRLPLAAALALTFITLFSIRAKLWFDPVAYSASFADQETYLGVPNFMNVATNIGFAGLGVFGYLRRNRLSAHYRRLGVLFSFAILGTAFGSGYFHFAPTPYSLFWDQLPMSIGFASFLGIVLADRFNPKAGLLAAGVLSILGPLSVWNIYYGSHETAYYLSLQFGTLIFAILFLLFTRQRSLNTKMILVGVFTYILAKVFETYDAKLFQELHVISGHSLKHIAATVALASIFAGAQKNT